MLKWIRGGEGGGTTIIHKSDVYFNPFLIVCGYFRWQIGLGLKSHQNHLCGALKMAQAGCPFLIYDVPG